jgi:hypothetical protein
VRLTREFRRVGSGDPLDASVSGEVQGPHTLRVRLQMRDGGADPAFAGTKHPDSVPTISTRIGAPASGR